MSTYGRQIIGVLDLNTTQVLADGENPGWKSGGLTLDWGVITAPNVDVELPDGQVIPAGVKYIRYGEILVPIHRSEVQTYTFSGTPASGTYTLGFDTPDGLITTGAINGTDNTAAIQAVIDATEGLETGDVTVSRTSNVVTVTYGNNLANLNVDPVVVTPTNLQTSAPAAITVAVATNPQGIGDSAGKYGPYRSDATDGRQSIVQGDCWVLNRTWREDEIASDYPGVFDAGRVWEARLAVGSGTQISLADFRTNFPRISYTR